MQRPTANAVTPRYGFASTLPPYSAASPHKGVDFLPTPDNRVFMPESGTVQVVAWDGKTAEGNVIYIRIANRLHALCHLSKFLVPNGQYVERGTPIGIMGSTGAADGVHLHWALKIDGVLVNALAQVNEPMKGDESMLVTEDEFYQLVRCYLRREPTVEEAKGMTRDLHTLLQTLWNNGGKQSYEAEKVPKKFVPFVMPALYVEAEAGVQ